MSVARGPIEETVELNLDYPSVSERYFTKYYFIPKERKKPESSVESNGTTNGGEHDSHGEQNKMEADSTTIASDKASPVIQENKKHKGKYQNASAQYDSSGHVCVMVHTNKLCLVTLSHQHPVLAQKKEVVEVNYDVGKINRLENQVSGKGKRGAQMMGLESPVCIITCSDGSKYTVLAGIQGKLVEVNERLLLKPQLLTSHPHSEGYLAVVLPPLRNGDFMRSRLLTQEQYAELGHDNLFQSN